MNPFVPILLLLTGAGAMLTGLALPRSRGGLVGLVPVAASAAALLAGLALGLRLPSELKISDWPDEVFGSGLTLVTDRSSWLFGLAILVAAVSVFLTGLARPGGARLGPRTASLLVAAAALAAVQAENPVTLAVTWAALDALHFVSLLLLADGEKIEERATLGLIFNVAGTFCVLAAAIDSLAGGQSLFRIGGTPLSERGVLLLMLAALFRLGVFPFHLGLPGEANIRTGLGTLLRLAPAAVALDLLTHVVVVAPQAPLQSWLSVAGCLGLFVAAMQWRDMDARQGVSYLMLGFSSLALLAALWGGEWAATGVLAFGLAAVLGGAVLFLNNGFEESQPLWAIPVGLGAYLLAGGPFMVGYVGAAVLYGGLVQSSAWVVFVAVLLGQALLAASFLRLLFAPGEGLLKGEPIIGVAYLFGLALPLAFGLIAGLAAVGLAQATDSPPIDLFAPGSLTALGAVVAAALGGAALWRFDSVVRAQAETVLSAASTVTRLDWLYRLLWDTYRFLGRVLRTAAAVVEGEGGVLWTIVAALLVWLLFR